MSENDENMLTLFCFLFAAMLVWGVAGLL